MKRQPGNVMKFENIQATQGRGDVNDQLDRTGQNMAQRV